MRTRNLSNGVRRAARPSWQIRNLFFSKIHAHNCQTPQTRGDRRADVGWWSSSLAKEDELVPKGRVACLFAARQVVLPDKYAPEVGSADL